MYFSVILEKKKHTDNITLNKPVMIGHKMR